jgi:hypothetical protein
MRAVFGPIGGVHDLRRRADHGAHVGRERTELAGGRVDARRRAHARERDELRPHDEAVDSASGLREMRIVQDVAPEAPLVGAAIGHLSAGDREICGRGDTEEGIDLLSRGGGRIDRAGPAGAGSR